MSKSVHTPCWRWCGIRPIRAVRRSVSPPGVTSLSWFLSGETLQGRRAQVRSTAVRELSLATARSRKPGAPASRSGQGGAHEAILRLEQLPQPDGELGPVELLVLGHGACELAD